MMIAAVIDSFLCLWLVASCVMKYIIGLIAVNTLIKQSTKKG